MKIGTKALASLMVVVMLTISAVPVAALGDTSSMHVTKQLDRLQQYHDRKMELRASVLGMTPDDLRSQLKTKSFNQIMGEHGFASRQAYNLALLGKLKDELKRRGWDERKIQGLLTKRLERKAR